MLKNTNPIILAMFGDELGESRVLRSVTDRSENPMMVKIPNKIKRETLIVLVCNIVFFTKVVF